MLVFDVMFAALKGFSIIWLITGSASSASSILPRTCESSFCNSTCKTLPGDLDWPKQEEWSELNKTVGGRLIATVPVASACHNPTFNSDICDELKIDWLTANPQYVEARVYYI